MLPGEQLFVVPGFKVQEPVPWDYIPQVVKRVQQYVRSKLDEVAPATGCGGCTACCYVYHIDDPELKKPSNTHCKHCTIGVGCEIYNHRPKACAGFACLWLKSQDRNDRMPLELRPDRCGVYFTEDSQTGDPLLIEVHGGEPDVNAWRWINEMQALGYKAKKITYYEGEK